MSVASSVNQSHPINHSTYSKEQISERTFSISQLETQSQNAESAPSFLLIKNVLNALTKDSVTELFKDKTSLSEVIVVKNSNNIYIKFSNPAELAQILSEAETKPIMLNGEELRMCSVHKLPLDLNEKSNIVLTTFYNEKIEVNAHSIFEVFTEFGRIVKIIVFKKKNFQALIQFESANDAFFFKQALHNVNFKGLFFLKIQFTRKNELVINDNNIYEFDYTNAETQKTDLVAVRLRKGSLLETTPSSVSQMAKNRLNTPSDVEKMNKLGDRAKYSCPTKENEFTRFNEKEGAEKEQQNIKRLFSKELPTNNWPTKFVVSKPENDDYKFQPIKGALGRNTNIALKVLDLEESVDEKTNEEKRTWLPIRKIKEAKLYEIQVSNVSSQCKHSYLFNLFSLYGEISRIKVDTNKETASIGFASDLGQFAATYYLNNAVLFGKKIDIEVLSEPSQRSSDLSDSKSGSSDSESELNNKRESEKEAGVVYYSTKQSIEENDSVQKRSMSKPTNTLLVTQIAASVPFETLRSLFEVVESVFEIIPFTSEGKSALVTFEKVEAASKVLSMFRNLDLMGIKLEINFSAGGSNKKRTEIKEVAIKGQDIGFGNRKLNNSTLKLSKKGSLWTPQSGNSGSLRSDF